MKNMTNSKEYWQGFNDAKRNADRLVATENVRMASEYMRALHDLKNVKGIGEARHQEMVKRTLVRLNNFNKVERDIDREYLVLELEQVDWNGLSDEAIAHIRFITEVGVK